VPHDEPPQIDPFTRDLIRRKARRLARRPGFRPQDCQDLEQELVTRLLGRLGTFDPGREALVTTIVKRCAANILRDRLAAKRDDRGTTSLHDPAGGDTPEDLASTLGPDEHAARLGRTPRTDEETVQLALDVAEVVARLPPDLRDLAERLMTQSVSQIAHDSGTPRTTLNDRVSRLRQRFEQAGLRGYL
jgi:RNA polymerase sigma-70 factor, ECF subfamily